MSSWVQPFTVYAVTVLRWAAERSGELLGYQALIAQAFQNFNPFTATGRIYTSQKRPCRWPRTYNTSNLNFGSTYLSKPGHRCGCCCMSPRCLLRQFVDRCLLSWALFIEKTVLLCLVAFCSNGGKQRCGCSQMRHKLLRAVRLMAFVTTVIEETTGFHLVESEGDGNDGGDWLGEETGDGGAW